MNIVNELDMGKNPHIARVRFCSGSRTTKVRFGSGSCRVSDNRVRVLFGFCDYQGSVRF